MGTVADFVGLDVVGVWWTKEETRLDSIDRPRYCVPRSCISPIPTSIFNQVRRNAKYNESENPPLRYYHLLAHILEKTGNSATGAIITWVRPRTSDLTLLAVTTTVPCRLGAPPAREGQACTWNSLTQSPPVYAIVDLPPSASFAEDCSIDRCLSVRLLLLSLWRKKLLLSRPIDLGAKICSLRVWKLKVLSYRR